MKNWIAMVLGALILVANFNAKARADWKSDWERVVEAAKKEGRLNLYWMWLTLSLPT